MKSESEVPQSCPTLHDTMDCSLTGSSVHGILQARVLEWGAIAFSAKEVLVVKKTHLLMQDMQETWFPSLGWEDPLEEGRATRSSILAWRLPWTEEPGGLQSIGSHRVGHD